MSWGEVSKINNNFNKTLNEQARELAYAGAYIFEKDTTFKPEKTGWYKVIVVGSGGETAVRNPSGGTNYFCSGGSGGVAISTLHLSSAESYPVEVTGDQSSFNTTIIATAGTDGVVGSSYSRGDGGTAEGGDFNYNGIDGVSKSTSVQYGAYGDGVSVGVYIPELMRREVRVAYGDSVYENIIGGYGILGYGASGGSCYGTITPTGKGAVIIIPLELEE